MTNYPGDDAPRWRRILWAMAAGLGTPPEVAAMSDVKGPPNADLVNLAQQRINNPGLLKHDMKIMQAAGFTGAAVVAVALILHAVFDGWVWYAIAGVYGVTSAVLVLFQAALSIWADGYITAATSQHDPKGGDR